MDLRHLRYFQAVAEELSFSKAARRLRVAQPALSRAVQELERDVGVSLIDRNRRATRLTPAGTVLLRETGVLLERLEDALRRVRRTASGAEGGSAAETGAAGKFVVDNVDAGIGM